MFSRNWGDFMMHTGQLPDDGKRNKVSFFLFKQKSTALLTKWTRSVEKHWKSLVMVIFPVLLILTHILRIDLCQSLSKVTNWRSFQDRVGIFGLLSTTMTICRPHNYLHTIQCGVHDGCREGGRGGSGKSVWKLLSRPIISRLARSLACIHPQIPVLHC